MFLGNLTEENFFYFSIWKIKMIYDLTDSILQKKATFTSLDGNVVYGVNRQQKVN